jgi:hypothetical protein
MAANTKTRVRKRVRGKGIASPPIVDIDEEQRRHLVDACAFFRAERFREVEPGQCRKQDVRAAEAAIDAVIAPRRGKAGRP